MKALNQAIKNCILGCVSPLHTCLLFINLFHQLYSSWLPALPFLQSSRSWPNSTIFDQLFINISGYMHFYFYWTQGLLTMAAWLSVSKWWACHDGVPHPFLPGNTRLKKNPPAGLTILIPPGTVQLFWVFMVVPVWKSPPKNAPARMPLARMQHWSCCTSLRSCLLLLSEAI